MKTTTDKPALGVKRLGTERIGKLLFELSSQSTFALLVYAMYTLTDMYFLSVGVGPLAAAGASIVAPVLLALGAISTTVGAGGASVVSRALGEQNTKRASKAVAGAHLIFWSAAIVFTVFGMVLLEPLVFLLGATTTIAPYAIEYGRIIFLGAITSTGFSAIIRADGNAKFATLIWVIPVMVNLILCWFFIMILKLGASGAALATVFGQTVSAGMGVYFFFFRTNRSYQLQTVYFKPDWKLLAEIILFGLPSLVKNLSSSLLAIVVNNLLRTMGGDNALSIYAVVQRLYVSFTIPQAGMVQAMQPIVGYNFGKQNNNRVWATIRLTIISVVMYGLLVFVICLLASKNLMALLSRNQNIIETGHTALQWMALAYPVTGVALVIAAVFQSLGFPGKALRLILGGILLVKLPVLLLAAQFFSLTGIWVSEAISELLLCLIALLLLNSNRNNLISKHVQTV